MPTVPFGGCGLLPESAEKCGDGNGECTSEGERYVDGMLRKDRNCSTFAAVAVTFSSRLVVLAF